VPLVLTKANVNAISLTLVLEHKVQGYHLGRWSGGSEGGQKPLLPNLGDCRGAEFTGVHGKILEEVS